jgi:hypothetical protein
MGHRRRLQRAERTWRWFTLPDWEREHLAQIWLTTPPGLNARINWAPDWPTAGADFLRFLPKTNFWHCILGTLGDAFRLQLLLVLFVRLGFFVNRG